MSKKKDTFKSLLGGAISQKVLSPKEEKEKLERQIKDGIIIFQELKDLIPPLQKEEYEQLEKNILADVKGIREPLKLWQTTAKEENGVWAFDEQGDEYYVLIDGHNRYSIAQVHNLDFPIEVLSFSSLQNVKDWMIHFQLGRRNLTPEQAAYLRGVLYNQLKQEKGGNEKVMKGKLPKYQNDTLDENAKNNTEEKPKYQNDTLDKNAENNTEEKPKYQNDTLDKNPENDAEEKPKYQNDTLVETADKLADKYNVSKITIKRDGKFAEALNVIGKVNPQLKEDLLAGVVKAKKSDIQELIKADINLLELNSVEDIAIEAEALRNKKKFDGYTLKLSKKIIADTLDSSWYVNQIDSSRKGKHLHVTNINIEGNEWDVVQFIQTAKQSYLVGITIINSLKDAEINPQLSDFVDLSLICVANHLKDKLVDKISLNENVIFISALREIHVTKLKKNTSVLEKKASLMEAVLTKLV